MSHTSQRRGLDPRDPGKELIVLAMVPSEYKDETGVAAAMSELALRMLEHHPENWISRNFTEIEIPRLGPAQVLIEWSSRQWPDATRRLLMRGLGRASSVVTAVYTNLDDVIDLITDLKGDWLARNGENALPISMVLSGLFDDVRRCCQRTETQQHTFLHSLGFFGSVEKLPSREELEIITMCGHGLVSTNCVRDMVGKVEEGLPPEHAADQIARPCVCGIVNRERAEEVLRRLVNHPGEESRSARDSVFARASGEAQAGRPGGEGERA
jgi:hypothetical protein